MNYQESNPAIAVLKFDDRNRYGPHGIPSMILLGDNSRTWVVNCKRPTKVNCWAKVNIVDSENRRADLIEILGPVGDYATELKALQLHFKILPCKYPEYDKSVNLPLDHHVEDCTSLHVFSVDDASTIDVDDAISLTNLDETNAFYLLGIHITNAAHRIPLDSELMKWAERRGASAYSGGFGQVPPRSVPMLPPLLSHEELSLKQDVPRYALTLWLTIEKAQDGSYLVINQRHSSTLIINKLKTTYEHFQNVTDDLNLVQCRNLLQNLSNTSDSHEWIAWCMIQYNNYFGKILASTCKHGLLRSQDRVDNSAVYVEATFPNPRHESLNLDFYAHCSSPIRRFSDLLNQHVILYGAKPTIDLGLYNERCTMIKHYHAHTDTMTLAYECRSQLLVVESMVELDEDGQSLLVHIPNRRRVRVPLRDNYFVEPIVDTLNEAIKAG